jgi:hypothetical protein
MQRIVRGPVAARTFAYERVFSIHFAAAAITIRHHIHSRRDEHTHTKQSRAPYTHTHIHDRYSVCASYLKKEARRESKDIHTHIHIYTSCACVFFRCRFFLLARQYRENDTPLTDWVTFLSLSLCLTRCSSIHLAVFIYRSEREREQRSYLFR